MGRPNYQYEKRQKELAKKKKKEEKKQRKLEEKKLLEEGTSGQASPGINPEAASGETQT